MVIRRQQTDDTRLIDFLSSAPAAWDASSSSDAVINDNVKTLHEIFFLEYMYFQRLLVDFSELSKIGFQNVAENNKGGILTNMYIVY